MKICIRFKLCVVKLRDFSRIHAGVLFISLEILVHLLACVKRMKKSSKLCDIVEFLISQFSESERPIPLKLGHLLFNLGSFCFPF